MAHLWIAIPLIVALLSLEANDALKVLVMFIVIGAGPSSMRGSISACRRRQ